MRITRRAYGCGTASRRYHHCLPNPPRASNDFLIRSSLPCEEEDGWRCLAGWRLHCSRSCCAQRLRTSQRRRILRGARTSPIARRCARGHPRCPRQDLRTSGRANGHPAGSRANAVRTGCPNASPRDRAPIGEKDGAPHISANRKKTHAFDDRGSPFVIHGSTDATGGDGLA
jgi:hypothetical protein